MAKILRSKSPSAQAELQDWDRRVGGNEIIEIQDGDDYSLDKDTLDQPVDRNYSLSEAEEE